MNFLIFIKGCVQRKISSFKEKILFCKIKLKNIFNIPTIGKLIIPLEFITFANQSILIPVCIYNPRKRTSGNTLLVVLHI